MRSTGAGRDFGAGRGGALGAARARRDCRPTASLYLPYSTPPKRRRELARPGPGARRVDVPVSFSPLVSRWFEERFGTPTPAQELGWPAIAGGADTLIAAPTGSGKTLAAFLWSV